MILSVFQDNEQNCLQDTRKVLETSKKLNNFISFLANNFIRNGENIILVLNNHGNRSKNKKECPYTKYHYKNIET